MRHYILGAFVLLIAFAAIIASNAKDAFGQSRKPPPNVEVFQMEYGNCEFLVFEFTEGTGSLKPRDIEILPVGCHAPPPPPLPPGLPPI